ncbi:SUN domain-containing protein 5-like [Neopelma chrysocephalum]|uniref:SUN domain-containing protein 5-like n=1 Tax=Neopelma chrysocephalum TaxID=114329 RepID=UPI000FCCFA8F|nr:SUN domain-containing protein 5-like [Neopelma chrysocephalum]
MARRKTPPRRRRGSARRCLGCEDEVAEVTVELRSSCADAPLAAALVNLHLEKAKEIARMFLRQICQLADDLVFLGRNHLSPYILKAQKMVQQKKSFRVYALLLSVYLVGVFCGTSLPAWTLLTKGLMQELTSVLPSGLKTFWNSDTLTETQKLQLLLEELSQELTKMTLESYVKTDWALKSSGATIDTQRTSQTYDCRESWVCRILYFFWTANPPDTILQPNVSPGSCWAFKGHQGQVVIKLPARVHPTAITVQHITKDVSPSGTVISAPKDIAVFGVDADGEEESLLGTFTYSVEKEPMQTFPLKDVLPPRAFSYVKLLVKSNWGNPWYTCIYRVQVHGRMETQKASTKIQDK